MSNVILSIGGRSYTVACAAGEEKHVTSLGQVIDEKLAQLGASAGQNETRNLLFAALLLADEVHELKHRTPESATPSPAGPSAEILEAIATRLENIASHLEG